MGLFTDIYNTVAKFFRPQEEPMMGEASKSVATNRLKLVLMQDRTNLTPKILEQMRGELVDLLSKYLEMDKDLLELNFEQEGDQVALMLSIPVIKAKDEDEIEALNSESAEEESEDDVDTADEVSEENDAEEITTEEDITDETETDIVSETVEVDSNVIKNTKKKSSKKVTAPEEIEGNIEVPQESSSEEVASIE